MSSDYQRVAQAIQYIRDNVKQQPDLEDVAGHIGLSPYHFQRLFQRWAGVSPKRFLEFLTVEQAKELLQQSRSVLDSSLETGLSGPGRLHDQFVSIEAVSPGEFKKRGAGMQIAYGFQQTPFGLAAISLSPRGILSLSFYEEGEEEFELAKLKSEWSDASFVEDPARTSAVIDRLFEKSSGSDGRLLLSIRGTNFQIKVWNALLRIPAGSISSYQKLADEIGKPKSVRAVANAIGANPVAYLIPCHRVLRSSGELSGYRWGQDRKRLMLAREWAQTTAP
ncbi:MAG: methylated-DNA--[protein]-cysteine S-methyltransferase [Gammaproteobacteria bacterium]|nr:methylated-DNA--[protein]-cysteine S-methyltransferase [Gammaproteobacteria bacterium]